MVISDEEIRSKQRKQWTAVSQGWITRREEGSDPTVPVTQKILELSAPKPGQRVLDLACGVGDPAFELARTVGSTGSVLGLDIAEAMVQGARTWARQHNVTNVEFRTIDSELELGVPPESFDLCTCRHGLMFMPRSQEVMELLFSVTKPGGRLTVSTWGLPQNSPVFSLPGEIIGRHAAMPAPDPDEPGLFSLSTPAMHTKLFRDTGFDNVVSQKFDCPVMVAASPEAMWEQIRTQGGPMVKVIGDMSPATRTRVREDFVETLSAKFPSGNVVLTGEAIVTSGQKPLA